MFEPLLFALRAEGIGVGLGEWHTFLRALEHGLAARLDDVYALGRAILVHTEAHYDAFDVAFFRTFRGLVADPKLALAFERWLQGKRAFEEGRRAGEHDFSSLEEMLEALKKRLEEQREEHHGGNRWVGTGGTSPWGTGGRANQGFQLGEKGQGRSGVRLPEDRRWKDYRTDRALDVRDFEVALRALRRLAKEGTRTLDVPETIAATCKNGGELELVVRPSRANRVRVALFMDTGGSMGPYSSLVEKLFAAASRTKIFKTFEYYYFHNCIYHHLWKSYDDDARLLAREVLERLTPEHRLIFVGDASMAPWELFGDFRGLGRREGSSGIEQLKAFGARCKASVWFNPEPVRAWDHPTVRAIGEVFKMEPLTLSGLRDGIRFLRAPT